MEKIKIYGNGLKLVVENMPSIRSVSIGIWVGAGSAKETPKTNGISHFTEHMLFKGTEKMSPFEIASAFEGMGAAVNAFTGKEGTCYYFKSVDETAEKCFSVLTDIFFDSSFPADELDKERKVIKEEINMVEDSPEDICYDLIAEAVFKDNPLGMTVLGPAANVARFNKSDIKTYMDKFYCADNIVIAAAGNITLETVSEWIDKYFLTSLKDCRSKLSDAPKAEIESCQIKRIKDFEQSNIALSFPSVRFNHPDSVTQSVLNVLLGGGMSSRLFQSIREQLGLAYSVYTAPSSYINNGTFNIYLNISAENTEKAVRKVKEELNVLTDDGINRDEFERAKAQIKSALVFSMENVQSVMTSMGKMMLLAGEVYDINKKIDDINAVTVSDANQFARNLFTDSQVCAAYVGKETKADVLDLLK